MFFKYPVLCRCNIPFYLTEKKMCGRFSGQLSPKVNALLKCSAAGFRSPLSDAYNTASVSPFLILSPTVFSISIPAPKSIESSLVLLPAPRAAAQRPMLSAFTAVINPFFSDFISKEYSAFLRDERSPP